MSWEGVGVVGRRLSDSSRESRVRREKGRGRGRTAGRTDVRSVDQSGGRMDGRCSMLLFSLDLRGWEGTKALTWLSQRRGGGGGGRKLRDSTSGICIGERETLSMCKSTASHTTRRVRQHHRVLECSC